MKLNEIVEKHGDQFVAVVEAELRKLAEEKPEFIYRTNTATDTFYIRCSYMARCTNKKGELLGPDCPGCIFGQAFQRLGWDDAEEMSLIKRIDLLIERHAYTKYVLICPETWILVQAAQDRGESWGEAILNLGKKETEHEAT